MNDVTSLLRRQSPVDYVRINMPLVASVLDQLVLKGATPVLVGGLVRDFLLGHPGTDIDVEIYGVPTMEDLMLLLSPLGTLITQGLGFGVVRYNGPEGSVDWSLPRQETHTGPGHADLAVTCDHTLSFEAAALRRDFTLNAMGIDWVSHQLIDPYDGQTDLANRCLRHLTPSFDRDPLRLLRTLHCLSRFECTLHPDTQRLCQHMSLASVSKERLSDEIKKWLLLSPRPSVGLSWFEPLGLLDQWPECKTYAQSDQWTVAHYALDTMRRIPSVTFPMMVSAWLVHAYPLDPDATTIVAPLLHRFSDSPSFVSPLLVGMATTHTLIQTATHQGVTDRDLKIAAKTAKLRWVIGLIKGAYPHSARLVRYLLSTATRLNMMDGPLPPLIKGRDLLGMGIPPGEHIQDILTMVYDAQIDGKLASKSSALAFIKDWWTSDDEGND